MQGALCYYAQNRKLHAHPLSSPIKMTSSCALGDRRRIFFKAHAFRLQMKPLFEGCIILWASFSDLPNRPETYWLSSSLPGGSPALSISVASSITPYQANPPPRFRSLHNSPKHSPKAVIYTWLIRQSATRIMCIFGHRFLFLPVKHLSARF